jgi:hypothetical protein
MRHPKLIAILSAAFALTMASSMAFGVAPGAQIELNAASENARPLFWGNDGTSGGKFALNADNWSKIPPPPKHVKAEGGEPAHYTSEVPSSSFGSIRGTASHFKLGTSWTIEIWLRRNGEAWEQGDENGLAYFGLGSEKVDAAARVFELDAPNVQYIRMFVADGAAGQIVFKVKVPQGKILTFRTEEGIGTGEWRQFAVEYKGDGKTLQSYIDGKAQKLHDVDVAFVPEVMDQNMVFLGQLDFDRNEESFNGSLSIIRVYDKALGAGGVRTNFLSFLAVEPADKLTTTWGHVKRGY